MKKMTLQSAAFLILVLAMQAVQAQSIIVQNSSFEDPVTANYASINGPNGNDGLPGWSHPSWVNSYVVKNGGLVSYTSGVAGNQTLFLEPYNDGGNSYVYQNTSQAFAAGTYTLSVDVGYGLGFATDGGNATANFQLLSYDGISYNYNLGVAATTVSAATLGANNGSLLTYNYTLNLDGSEGFIGNDAVIFLQAQTTTPGSFQNVSYDNVRLDFTAVPEPSTAALTISWAAGLALMARRRVKA
jgi:hypothetical protein